MLKLTIVKLAVLIYLLINLIFLFLKFDSIQLSDEAFLNKKSTFKQKVEKNMNINKWKINDYRAF